MKICIYQINSKRDVNRLRFMPLCHFQEADFDSSIYDLVWSGETDEPDLDGIFMMFNLKHPVDFTGHSLSVSDVVEILDDGSNTILPGCYFCDTMGWEKVAFDTSQTGIKAK